MLLSDWREALVICHNLAVMADGMLSAQQFEKGSRSFARIWESGSNADRLWTWAPSGNKLVICSQSSVQHLPSTVHMLAAYFRELFMHSIRLRGS